MTNRDKLIELVDKAKEEYAGDVTDHTETDYIVECLLNNGVIIPPCKVGDMVYYIHETFYDNEYMKAKEDEIDFSQIIKVVERPNCKTNLMLEKAQFDWLLMDRWLKGDVFLTREEAEKALERSKGNREILFRGKDIYGKWLYGDLINLTNEIKQICNHTQLEHAHSVDIKTIGQYTGLTDKNGKKIFEGDIVETNKRKKYEVRFYKSAWAIWNDKYKFDYEKWDFLSTFAQKIKIIGNIHDNPELLGGGVG